MRCDAMRCWLQDMMADSLFFFFSRRRQVSRPIGRMGGITYTRVTQGFELPRPDFNKDLGGEDGVANLKRAASPFQADEN